MVQRGDIVRLATEIGQRFDVERVVLFGSQASGSAGEHSDVDLLVVGQFAGRRLAAAREIWTALKPSFSVDLLVYNPVELARRVAMGDPVLSAAQKGEVLYERPLARVG